MSRIITLMLLWSISLYAIDGSVSLERDSSNLNYCKIKIKENFCHHLK